jgi:hypothetical protein
MHQDGNTAGYLLRADGTRYIPADPTTTVPLAPVAQGDLIIADGTPAWSILTLGAAAGYALVSTATSAAWSQTPTWTGDHTWDDGSGDSPACRFVGGSNDDTIVIFLDNSTTANNSDLVVRLCATDDDSKFQIEDSGSNIVAYIDADGGFDMLGHAAIGEDASIGSTTIVYIDEDLSGASEHIGIDCFARAEPSADFSGNWRGIIGTARLDTAETQTSGLFLGVYGKALINGGIAGTAIALHGGLFLTDVEDGTVTNANGVYAYTPLVDTGGLTTGAGVRIEEGTVGAGSITTLYGLYIASITAGDTNFSIFTGTGLVRLGDVINFAGAMGNSTKNPTSDAPVDWVECQIGGTTRYLPAYAS